VVEVSASSKHILRSINVNTEVKIVHLLSISLVHILLQQELHYRLLSKDAQLIKDSYKLSLGHMSRSRNVKVLKHRLQVQSSHNDLILVCEHDLHHGSLLISIKLKIFLSCYISI